MPIKSFCRILAVVCFVASIDEACSQCTFNSTFLSTTWHDSTRGTLTFSTSTVSGLSIIFVASTVTQTLSAWQCSDHSDDSYLVLRTTNTFNFLVGSSYKQVYAYMCMKLTSITNFSFYYYLQQIQQYDLGGERLKVSESATLNRTQVCDSTITVPPSEFHVLVKSGSESSAAISCPNAFLFSAGYYVITTTGSTLCNGTTANWDVCTDNTQMTFDYTKCTTEVAYSAGGELWCVATISDRGYTFVSVYNQDSSIVSTTRRFSCLSTDGTFVSVAPNNCTAIQTPYSFPTAADQTTTLGQRLVVTNISTSCDNSTSTTSSSNLTTGEIVAIVISVLFVLFWGTTITIVSIIVVVCLFYGACLFLILVCELSGFNDTEAKPAFPISDIPSAHPKLLPPLENVAVTNPKNILLSNGNHGLDVHNATHKIKDQITPRRKKV